MQDVGTTVSRQTLAATPGQQQVIHLASCTPARPAPEVANLQVANLQTVIGTAEQVKLVTVVTLKVCAHGSKLHAAQISRCSEVGCAIPIRKHMSSEEG